MQRLLVIDCDLFAAIDVAQREEKHVAINGFHVSVRPAGVIDVMGAVSATSAIETEAAVNIADAQYPTLARSLRRFQI